jgi:N-dimethylarginine dimethylaminohydrolase
VNPRWLGELPGCELVPVAPDVPPAATVVSVVGQAIMASAYPRTAAIVAKRARDVLVVDLDEFAKGDGCATCLSLLLVNP